jgi:hypothetical protein
MEGKALDGPGSEDGGDVSSPTILKEVSSSSTGGGGGGAHVVDYCLGNRWRD